jgi:hypothetical protein
MSEAATKSTGVWGTLRTVVPRWNQKAPSPKDSRSAVQVTAAAAGCAVLDPPAGSSLERTSASRPAEQRERQQRQRGEHPAGDGPADFGYKRGLERKYRVLRELGRGGNGVVRVVEELATGAEWALKSIPKVLNDPKLSETKRKGHAEAVKREVEVLRRLRGCLNVAALEDVYEDDGHVHMVLELCRGGELHHRIGETHYSGEGWLADWGALRARGCASEECLLFHGGWAAVCGAGSDLASDAPLVPATSHPHRRAHGGLLHACRAAHAGAVPLPEHPAPRHQAGQLPAGF